MRRLLLILIVPSILLGGCVYDRKRDDSKNAWLQHKPTAWKLTPDGHMRDAGPFDSMAGDWITEQDVDAAVDSAFQRFALNDDYAMWINPPGAWASGAETTGRDAIGVCLWTRAETAADPGSWFIVRPPGNYWGVEYANYRHTAFPLCPALEHELLHTVIDD